MSFGYVYGIINFPHFFFAVELSYYEEAATLAEKYEDYLSLILLCEKTQDTEKLEHYKQSFGKQVFIFVITTSKFSRVFYLGILMRMLFIFAASFTKKQTSLHVFF